MRRHSCVPCLRPTVHVHASGLPCLSPAPPLSVDPARRAIGSTATWSHRRGLCLGACLLVAGLLASLRPGRAYAEPTPGVDRRTAPMVESSAAPAPGPPSDVVTFWLRMRHSPASPRDPVVFLRQSGQVLPWPLQRTEWKGQAYKLTARLQDVSRRAQGSFEMITLVNTRWVPSPEVLRGDLSDAERVCGSGCRIVIHWLTPPHS